MKMGKIAVTPNNDKAASHSKDENLATNTIKKNVKPKYGDAAFLEYTRLIVNHPNYFGMPDPLGKKVRFNGKLHQIGHRGNLNTLINGAMNGGKIKPEVLG